MKTTLYLHIGMPKTGTSAIQAFFHNNMDTLETLGCKYPYFKHKYPYISLNRNGHFLVGNTYDEKVADECFSEIESYAGKYSKIILTDEEIWSVDSHTPEFWENLKNRLAKADIQLKTIVYLRRQDAFIASIWAQRVKYKKMMTCTFKQYLKSHQNRLDYYECMNLIADVIGKENVIVRPYEFSQFQGKGNTLISDCLLAMGIDWDDRFVYDNNKRNLSIEGNVLEAKRFLNMVPEFRKKGSKFRVPLEATQKELMSQGKYRNCSTFLKGEREAFMKDLEEGNKALAKEYLGREDGIFFQDSIPQNDPEKKNYTIDELMMILDLIQKNVESDPNTLFSKEEFASITASAKNLVLEKMTPKKKTPEKVSLFQKIINKLRK